MAIYLGGNKVSPSLNTVIIKTITQDTSGNTISQSQATNTNYVMEDPDNLASDLPIVNEWTRPTGWPNLNSLPALDEGVYLTYDNTSRVDYKYACFYCDVQSSGQYTVAQGHINGSSFVQDATWNVNTATYKEVNYSGSSYNYIIFKITPTTATKHLTSFYFGRIPAATTGTLAQRPQYDQYCLERIGKLPYLNSTSGSGDGYRYCTEWMEHDKVEFGNAVTSLGAAWYRGRSLRKIEFGNWTGENCNITSLSSTFEACNNIEKIDLSQWNTTNWNVGSIASMFNSCYSMKVCLIPFNTTNWGSGASKTFQMQLTWANCLALEQLDLSSWDVHDLTVQQIHQCWYQCIHLKSLNVKNWNTTKWIINQGNSLYHLFSGCRMLVDIDLSGWNTVNWQPTRADSIFYNNNKRRSFDDIKNWDTTNWKIAQFSDAFNGCYKIQELDLRNWNTSGWKVTTLSNTFGNMHSVRKIDLTGWNTSQWVVTNINYIFANDYNLEEIKGFWNWNVSNWPVTNGMYQIFNNCYRLKEIDFSNWVTTKFAFSTTAGACDIRYMCAYCYNAKKINFSPFNVQAISSLTYYAQNDAGNRSYSPFAYCYNLEELTLPSNYRGHIDLSDMYKLPRSEFIKTFNALSSSPIGTTAKVWIIGTKYKLTTADIAIATNKGYTVVQS